MILLLKILSLFPSNEKFLQDILSRGDVWMIRVKHVVEWIKSPTSLDDIENFRSLEMRLQAPTPCVQFPERLRLL